MDASRDATTAPVLLAGATGYVGGRLLAALERDGVPVRCLVRRPEALAGRVAGSTELVRGDCLDAGSLPRAFQGVETAYYLVHSMGAGPDFAALDEQAARNFAGAAERSEVQRIVYLGGLGDEADDLSGHLRSRQRTGAVLRDGCVPVVELRASIVIGSGSLSYDLIRALVERLPVMICPRWVRVPAQPIAVEDVVAFLLEARQLPPDEAGVYEIGGPEPASYGEIMLEYARQRGLKRWLIPVPLLTPRLSSLWLGLVTPVYARVGRKLIDGLRNPTVVRSDRARRTFRVRPRTLAEAVARARSLEDAELAHTRWSDALSASALRRRGWGGVRFGTRIVDSRVAQVPVPPGQAFAPIRRIGGARGWYSADWLWRVRGFLDLLAGGVGVRRGRRDPERLHVGDPLDWWRVEDYREDRLLRLAAEMKLPGRAWLQFEVEPEGGSGSSIRQTAIFDPAGLLGLAYWYLLYPMHAAIFRGMLAGIAARAAPPSSAGPARAPALELRSRAAQAPPLSKRRE